MTVNELLHGHWPNLSFSCLLYKHLVLTYSSPRTIFSNKEAEVLASFSGYYGCMFVFRNKRNGLNAYSLVQSSCLSYPSWMKISGEGIDPVAALRQIDELTGENHEELIKEAEARHGEYLGKITEKIDWYSGRYSVYRKKGKISVFFGQGQFRRQKKINIKDVPLDMGRKEEAFSGATRTRFLASDLPDDVMDELTGLKVLANL